MKYLIASDGSNLSKKFASDMMESLKTAYIPKMGIGPATLNAWDTWDAVTVSRSLLARVGDYEQQVEAPSDMRDKVKLAARERLNIDDLDADDTFLRGFVSSLLDEYIPEASKEEADARHQLFDEVRAQYDTDENSDENQTTHDDETYLLATCAALAVTLKLENLEPVIVIQTGITLLKALAKNLSQLGTDPVLDLKIGLMPSDETIEQGFVFCAESPAETVQVMLDVGGHLLEYLFECKLDADDGGGTSHE